MSATKCLALQFSAIGGQFKIAGSPGSARLLQGQLQDQKSHIAGLVGEHPPGTFSPRSVIRGKDFGDALFSLGLTNTVIFPGDDQGMDIQSRTSIGMLILEIENDGNLRDICCASLSGVERPESSIDSVREMITWVKSLGIRKI
jgi:hypothetical protein